MSTPVTCIQRFFIGHGRAISLPKKLDGHFASEVVLPGIKGPTFRMPRAH